MILNCFINVGNGVWTRGVTFPFPPFPGLVVGSYTVQRVLACQGNLDGAGSVEVELEHRAFDEEPDPEMMRGNGWRWTETREGEE